MTEEQRDELRRGIEALVRAASSEVYMISPFNSPVMQDSQDNIVGQAVTLRVHTHTVDADSAPPLTTAQILALSVLVGDPDMLPQALADYLIDHGTEPAQRRAPIEFRDFIGRLSSRVRNTLSHEGITSFEELLNEEFREGTFEAFSWRKVDPIEWRQFGRKGFEELTSEMEKAGVKVPAHWTKP